MEEFSEGHKDMMEPPNTRNPPERCPRPLYSRDSTQEGHTIPHHHQSGNLNSKVEVKEEIKEEDGVMEEYLKEHKDMYQDTMVGSSSYRNPPERCPRPLYSTQEGHTTPHHHQGEDLIDIKVEVKSEEEEETYVGDDQQSMEEDGITGTFIEEDTPTEISTGGSLTLNTFLHRYCSLIGPVGWRLTDNNLVMCTFLNVFPILLIQSYFSWTPELYALCCIVCYILLTPACYMVCYLLYF
ncbi:uncharacterized protein LOC143955898 [Lithobates pipiens]